LLIVVSEGDGSLRSTYFPLRLSLGMPSSFFLH